jgi:hypothetical protein
VYDQTNEPGSSETFDLTGSKTKYLGLPSFQDSFLDELMSYAQGLHPDVTNIREANMNLEARLIPAEAINHWRQVSESEVWLEFTYDNHGNMPFDKMVETCKAILKNISATELSTTDLNGQGWTYEGTFDNGKKIEVEMSIYSNVVEIKYEPYTVQ